MWYLRVHTRTSDFKRPIETLQKIKEKRQKEAEEREKQEAIARGCVSLYVTCVAASQTRSGSKAILHMSSRPICYLTHQRSMAGEKKPPRKHREDSDSDTEAQEFPVTQVASGPSIEAGSRKDQSGGVDQFSRGLSVGGVKMGAGPGRATGSQQLPAKVALKNRLAQAKAKVIS